MKALLTRKDDQLSEDEMTNEQRYSVQIFKLIKSNLVCRQKRQLRKIRWKLAKAIISKQPEFTNLMHSAPFVTGH